MTTMQPGPACRTDRDIRFGRLAITLSGAADRRLTRPAPATVAEGEFLLVIPLRGPIVYAQDDRVGTVGPGDYVLLSTSRFFSLTSDDDLLHWAVRIPPGDLRARLPALDDHLAGRFAANPGMAQLLTRVVGLAVETFAQAPPPNAEALATELIDFVALAVGAEDRGTASAPRSARFRLRRRVLDYIDHHLGESDLSPRSIADHHRMSQSYLYSLFSDNRTTVSQYILAKRLQWAYEMLISDASGALTVAEVAYRAGFKSVSHFSRSFSRHFGHAPRDIRRSCGVQAGQSSRSQVSQRGS